MNAHKANISLWSKPSIWPGKAELNPAGENFRGRFLGKGIKDYS